jgi:hypothetical protein
MKIKTLLSEDGLEAIVDRELGFLVKERGLEWKGKTIDDIGDSKELNTLIEDQEQLEERRRRRVGMKFKQEPIEHPPWVRVKFQLYLLFCTKDPNYAGLRKEMRAKGKHTETTIVSLVTAAVATHLGIAVGALVPLCALGLLGMLKIGQNAYCEKAKLVMPIKAPSKKEKGKKLKTNKL